MFLGNSFRVDVKYVYQINMKNRKFEIKCPYWRVKRPNIELKFISNNVGLRLDFYYAFLD